MKMQKVSSKKPIFYIYAILLGILVLSSVVLTVASATKGAEIAYLERERYEAKQQLEELSSQVVSSNSLSEVSENIDELGLVKPQMVIYLNHQETVASLQ